METEQPASRVVIITGATGGLGPAVVRRFAASGERLVLTGLHQADLDKLVATEQLADVGVVTVAADLTQPDGAEQVVAAAVEQFGRVDLLVHVTGGFAGGQPVAESDWRTWRFMLDLNLSAAYGMARAVLPQMLRQGVGKLVFVSSRVGVQPVPTLAAYSVSKSGLDTLVEVLAAENRMHNINVNAVAPSVIDTPTNRASNPEADYSTWVSPASLAQIIFFLCSAAADNIHGAIIPVYGKS